MEAGAEGLAILVLSSRPRCTRFVSKTTIWPSSRSSQKEVPVKPRWPDAPGRKITPGGPQGRVRAGGVEAAGPVGAGGDRQKELDRGRGEGPDLLSAISPIKAGHQMKDLTAGAEEAGVARHPARGPGVFVVHLARQGRVPG